MLNMIRLVLLMISFISFKSDLNGIEQDKRSEYVLVSVAPHRFFVNKIAGQTIRVGLMVPAGASAHTFEPTPKQTLLAGKADIWFRIGESFEDKAIQALKSHRAEIRIVDLRDGIDLIIDDQHTCKHHKGSADLHFWLSPRLAKIQAETIASALIQVYPEHRELYLSNLKLFKDELDQIDCEIQSIIKDVKQKTIMISHPAYAYFAKDYGFTQFSIEFEGKDPTPKLLTKILQEAQDKGIKTIFTQPQYSNKGALLIAKQIGASVQSLNPYSEDYFESLLFIAKQFANQ